MYRYHRFGWWTLNATLHPTNLRNLRIIERLHAGRSFSNGFSRSFLSSRILDESIEKSRPRPNGKCGRVTSIICSRMHTERRNQAERTIVEPVLFLKFAPFPAFSPLPIRSDIPEFLNFWLFIEVKERVTFTLHSDHYYSVIYENRIGRSADSGSSFTQRQSFSATRCLQSVSTSDDAMAGIRCGRASFRQNLKISFGRKSEPTFRRKSTSWTSVITVRRLPFEQASKTCE